MTPAAGIVPAAEMDAHAIAGKAIAMCARVKQIALLARNRRRRVLFHKTWVEGFFCRSCRGMWNVASSRHPGTTPSPSGAMPSMHLFYAAVIVMRRSLSPWTGGILTNMVIECGKCGKFNRIRE